jgi:hypothetical protein
MFLNVNFNFDFLIFSFYLRMACGKKLITADRTAKLVASLSLKSGINRIYRTVADKNNL